MGDEDKPAVVVVGEEAGPTSFKTGAMSAPPTWAQLNASRFAMWILIGIFVIVVLDGIFLAYDLSRIPPLDAFAKLDSEHAVELHEKMRSAVFDHAETIFKDVVLSAFLPIVTLLFGYAFGSSRAKAADGQ